MELLSHMHQLRLKDTLQNEPATDDEEDDEEEDSEKNKEAYAELIQILDGKGLTTSYE